MKTIEELWKKIEKIELVQVRPVEMEAVYKHCFEFENPVIVEVGSAHGASSTILAEAARELLGVVVCIDSYPENYYDQEKFGNYARQAFKKNVLQKYREEVKFLDMDSEEASQRVKELFEEITQPIDVLFLDGNHSYEKVFKECEDYFPMLKSGGYVAFHDYNNVMFHGVKRAADEYCAGWEKTDDAWDLVIFRKP
jgi:predicted O-methyltransferase YrrM